MDTKFYLLNHSKETFLLALSRLFERAGYYGIRTLFILYLIGETINMETLEAYKIYGFFIISVYGFQFIGGIFGDFILKNKNAILIGGILEFLACFIICIPSIYSFYIGIGVFAMGAGLFSPNIIAEFGKLYNKKEKLLDAGYSLFYFAINIGSVLGVFLIGLVGKYKFYYGFILASLFFIVATFLTFLVKKTASIDFVKNKYLISNRIVVIVASVIISTLFWGVYELSFSVTIIKQSHILENTNFNLPVHFWSYLNQFITLFFSLILVVLWSFFYTSQIYKLIVGFILSMLAIFILFYIPDKAIDTDFPLFLIAIILLGISELFIAPIVLSVLAKYANPKYLATLIGSSFFIVMLGNKIFSYAYLITDSKSSNFTYLIGIIILSVVLLALIIYLLIKNSYYKKNDEIAFKKTSNS